MRPRILPALLIASLAGAAPPGPWDEPARPDRKHLVRSIVGVADDEASILDYIARAYPAIEHRRDGGRLHEFAVSREQLEDLASYLKNALTVRSDRLLLLEPSVAFDLRSWEPGWDGNGAARMAASLDKDAAALSVDLQNAPVATGLLRSRRTSIGWAARADRYWRRSATLRLRMWSSAEADAAPDADPGPDARGFADRWSIRDSSTPVRPAFDACRLTDVTAGIGHAADQQEGVVKAYALVAEVGGRADSGCSSSPTTVVRALIPRARLDEFESRAAKLFDVPRWYASALHLPREASLLAQRDALLRERDALAPRLASAATLRALIDSELDWLKPLDDQRERTRTAEPVELSFMPEH